MTHTPLPWRIDQDNADGVSVVGANGNLVHYEDFGGIPTERGAAFAEQVIGEARANAALMVSIQGLADALEEICRATEPVAGGGPRYVFEVASTALRTVRPNAR